MSQPNDPNYWYALAAQMDTLADKTKDPITRQIMRRIASDYETIATRTKDRLAETPNGDA